MTVITKPISEKKSDKLDQPLVNAEVVPNKDVEAGQQGTEDVSLPNTPDPRYLVLRARARRASSLTTLCLFFMALLVMCCGIIAGVYFYKEFAQSQMHSALHRLKCNIPYEGGEDFHEPPQRFNMEGDTDVNDNWNVNMLKKLAQSIALFREEIEDANKIPSGTFQEEFEINDEDDSYEKITVPNLGSMQFSRYIHDFSANKTGIIDLTGQRCFVMPLNRENTLPPRDLLDLVKKMAGGYYEVDPKVLSESFRVVLPPVEDLKSLGRYIENECRHFPVYRLEKIVSGVTKRSVHHNAQFMQFAGKTVEFNILNFEDVENYENSAKS